MITLEDFKNNNLKINWKVIDIGCLGSEIFKNELSYDDILNFSLEKFDEKNKLILRIVGSDRDEYQEIGYLVQELANMEKPGFRDCPNGFKIKTMIIGKDYYTRGFKSKCAPKDE